MENFSFLSTLTLWIILPLKAFLSLSGIKELWVEQYGVVEVTILLGAQTIMTFLNSRNARRGISPLYSTYS